MQRTASRIRHTGTEKTWGERLANVASTLRLAAERLGWLQTMLWLCASVGRRFSTHVFVVTTHPIADDEAANPVEMAGLEGRVLSHDEVMRFFNRTEGNGYSRAFALDALSRGNRCFGMFEDGRLLWYCWYAREAAPIFDDVDATADFPFLYAHNAHTDAAHRGRGLHRIGVEASGRLFAREGFRALTVYIEARNLAPLLAARKMGEEVEGLVVVYRGASGVRWIASPGCRKASFRIRRRSAEMGLRRTADEHRRSPARTGTAPARRGAYSHPHS